MSVYEMAKAYYPRLWDKSRLEILEKGTITEADYQEITGEAAQETAR